MHPLVDIVRRARRSFAGSLTTRFVAVVAAASLTGASAGVLPAVIGRAVGAVSGSGPSSAPPGAFAKLVAAAMPAESTWAVVGITLFATVVAVGIGVLSSRMGTSLSGDVTAALRIEMLSAVLGASARDVEQLGAELSHSAPRGVKAPPGKAPPKKQGAATHEAAVRLAVTREAAMVSEFAVAISTGLPQSIATLSVLAIELIGSDAWIVLVGGVGLFALSRLLADRASRRVGEARRELQTADAAVFGNLGETLEASEDLRLWGARDQAIAEFSRVARECAASRARFATAMAVAGQIKSVFTAMAPLLIVVTLKLSGRDYGPGDVAKLLLLVPLLMIRMEALDAMRQGMLERGPLIRAALSLLDLAPAPERADDAVTPALDEVKGHVKFDKVTFTPPGATRPLIEDLDLEIPPGSVVGICGPSGSGKSTLLRLLLRLDDPDRGRITIDGTALDRIEPDALPRLFGVVRQTSQLLQRAVRDNLAIGLEPVPGDEAMRKALAAVHLDELAREGGDLRNLDTAYRKNPPSFSGGECRRLLLARMLLAETPIVALDEPEAGLPSGTAERILETIAELAKGKTHVVVTHAPHLLGSDFNVVLDGGRLVATGTHEELVAGCEVYRALLAESLKTTAAAPPDHDAATSA